MDMSMNRWMQSGVFRARAAVMIALCVTLSVGCSGRSLVDPAASAGPLANNEGLVYGSFLVVVDRDSPVPSGSYEWYGPEDRRTFYELLVHRRGSMGYGTAASTSYVRTRAWEAVPFVAKMRAGKYKAGRMNMYIGSAEHVKRRLVDTRLGFAYEVEPGKTTYLGRMVVAVPTKMIPRRTKVTYWVEDHAEEDLAALGLSGPLAQR
jgi:hypothetical protein